MPASSTWNIWSSRPNSVLLKTVSSLFSIAGSGASAEIDQRLVYRRDPVAHFNHQRLGFRAIHSNGLATQELSGHNNDEWAAVRSGEMKLAILCGFGS